MNINIDFEVLLEKGLNLSVFEIDHFDENFRCSPRTGLIEL